eukprot:gb/GFBE01066841.1/.p1 GENE.gb/GFBE01066841.1/~~gb/GFBE01066841.1/.p1  ORF type:complete len:521 (+),score=113.08 gb/GFBE01066841.1/:1-1563(+)
MQAVVDAVFAGLQPEDFGGDVRFVAVEALVSPSGFEDCWTTFSAGVPLTELPWISDAVELEKLSMVLLLVNFDCPGQVAALSVLIGQMDAQEMAPPILCLPLSAGYGSSSGSGGGQLQQRQQLTEALLELGADDVLEGQPSGFGLVLAARAAVERSIQRVEKVSAQTKERAAASELLASLRSDLRCTLWEYLPLHLASPLPPIDPSVSLSNGGHIAGWTLGRRLSAGSIFGAVHEAHPPPGVPGGSSAMKVVPKSIVTSLNELNRLKRMLSVLDTLRSEQWRHPGIAALQGIFHTTTHLFIRIERGAGMTLYQRLGLRDREEDPQVLSVRLLASIVNQVACSVAHLHDGPNICHRDIKPENFNLSEESGEGIKVQLTEFDFSMVQSAKRRRCRSSCGTFPFMAPEVLLQRDYCGFAADLWSVGMVILEVMCQRRVVERSLELGACSEGAPGAHSAAERLAAEFDGTGRGAELFWAHGRVQRQAREAPAFAMACDQLLLTDADKRWTAARLQKEWSAAVHC